MKMKRLWTLLFVILIAFCFAGCGNTNAETSDRTSNGTAVMSDFSTKTLDGDTFTQDNLAEYDLTMVNIWTTWCGYCVDEMPELQKVYDNLPENVNMISICCDADSDADLADEITAENGCTFAVLIPDDKLTESLLSMVSAYPTTVFVDGEGNLVGDPQVGVATNGDTTADAYLKLIDERLDQLD